MVPARRGRLALLLWILVALGSIWAAVYHCKVDILPYDDAYITYRYADRLAAGSGMTYNDGEKVFGSSSPLHVLWLAGLKRILPGLGTPLLAVRGNLLFFLAAVLLAVAAVGRIGGRTVGMAAGALLSVNPFMQSLSGGGMESFMFVALLLGALWGCAADRLAAAGALAGFSLLVRPEGALVMGAVATAWLFAGRRRPWLFAALLLAPGLAWTVFATAYYGTPIPQSITAKLAPLYPLPRGYALLTLLSWFGRWTFIASPSAATLPRDVLALLLVEVCAFGVLLSRRFRRARGWLLPVLLNAFVVFYALGNPLLFDWYTAPVFALWLPSLLLGSITIGERLCSGPLRRLRPQVTLPAAVVILLVGGVAASYGFDAWRGRSPMAAARTATRLRTLAYGRAARWLNGVAPPSATLATPEAGALGYYWHGRVLDACGLVSPQALPFLPVPDQQREGPMTGAISETLIESERPELVATLAVFARRSILSSDWFARNYRQIHSVPLVPEIWGSREVLIFQRDGTGASRGQGQGVAPP